MSLGRRGAFRKGITKKEIEKLSSGSLGVRALPGAKIVRKLEPVALPEKIRARGSSHTRGEMNKLEARYAEKLELERLAGAVAWYSFEILKFKIGEGAYFTPDFVVMKPDGLIECHEVKGSHWREAARVRIKVAASLFPFKFLAVQKPTTAGGTWEVEEF